jgi:outer membrane murein-binding lipoprotein Lpp
MNRRIETLKKSIFVVAAILVCSLLFSGCGKKSNDEALKWKQEYDKLYVVNQNLKGQIEAQKQQVQELTDRIAKDQQTIAELQQKLQEKN